MSGERLIDPAWVRVRCHTCLANWEFRGSCEWRVPLQCSNCRASGIEHFMDITHDVPGGLMMHLLSIAADGTVTLSRVGDITA